MMMRMRTMAIVCGVGTVLAVLGGVTSSSAQAAPGADLSGTWTGSVCVSDTPKPMTLTLHQDGKTLTGKVDIKDVPVLHFTDGALTGQIKVGARDTMFKFTAPLTPDAQNRARKASFGGTLKHDELQGGVEVLTDSGSDWSSDQHNCKFTLKRAQ